MALQLAAGLCLALTWSKDPITCARAMPMQMTVHEQTLVDKVLRRDKGCPMDGLREINKRRRRSGADELGKWALYRYIKGATHVRGAAERRGRKRVLEKVEVNKLEQARKRLLKAADGTTRVTYADIHAEAGLQDTCGQRVVADALRAKGVRFRAPRRKVCISQEDAKERLRVGKIWVKRPASFWAKHVHAYVDNKAFPLPLTPAQRKRYQRTRVTGHLRTPAEGVTRGCTKPREKHSFLGLPSVTITAAVAKDKIILWHVVGKSWNGTAAADMYRGPLSRALKKTWGWRTSYRIVEDGDRKGNQSGLGVAAKQKAKIRAMTLPPRTPSWMPLDYAIWAAIEKAMDDTVPAGKETKTEYLARLEKCARSLPRGFIRKVIARMKGNIQGVIDARGFHAKDD